MPNNKLHMKLWQMNFGSSSCPFVHVDKEMDKYSKKLPGIRHRLKDHDPLRAGDYEDPEPELDKWRIVYRFFHVAVDSWWTELSKEERKEKYKEIMKGIFPVEIDKYFWKIIDAIEENPLSIYEVLPFKCDPLPAGWKEYIKKNMKR